MDLSLNRINTLQLAGVNDILGIDQSDNSLDIAELKSRAGLFNKYHSKYEVVNTFSIEFEKVLTSEEKGKRLAKELQERGIKTRFCVSSISSAAARTVVTEVPSDVEDIETWIKENCEKFVRVPIPFKNLAFSHEILPSTDAQPRRCKISFVRETERKDYISLFSNAGLHLLSLGLNRDLSEDQIITSLCPEGYSGNHAVELAIRGFVPELNSTDFLNETEKKETTEERDKSLFYRTVLALGVVLFILLGIQFGLNTYFQSRSDKIDEQLLQVGPVYSEVTNLGRQVSALRSELNGSGGNRSDVAKVLHDIAEATPDGVWLYKLNITQNEIDLFGYARSNELAASYLGLLQKNRQFSNVQVVRVGAPTESESVSFENSGIKSVTTFELKMKPVPRITEGVTK